MTMLKSDTHRRHIPRRLTRVDKDGERHEIDDGTLLDHPLPIVILGEPGMGKTWLLEQLAKQPSMQFVRASALVRNPARIQSSRSQTLVIDALDEVAALQEGDPLHNVLKALATLNYPPFILSCRAADWHGAIAKADIAEDYIRAPEEWTLESITHEEALGFLGDSNVDQERATHLIEQLEKKNLTGLYENPLTLGLLVKVVSKVDYSLPDTRADLFEQAIDVLRLEHNPRYANTELAQLAKENALDAAGATMAALLLTGKDTISIMQTSGGSDNYLSIAEVTALPEGNHAKTLLHSRLFRAAGSGEGRFVPLHRTIAEYLGARWLAKQIIENGQAKARLFALLTADGLVPASLRGLHAWLAHWDAELAETVIANDPFGLLRYGDADDLSVQQGRELVAALQRLEEENPYFRAGDWGSYSARGLTHTELTDVMRAAITDQGTGYQLRSLLLESISGTEMATALRADLEVLLRDTELTYAERINAGEALACVSESKIDWPRFILDLCHQTDENSPRLALNLIREVGAKNFSEKLIVEAVLAVLGMLGGKHRKRDSIVGGTLYGLGKTISDERLATVLDCLADRVAEQRTREDVDPDNWAIRSELSSFSRQLIVRQLDQGIDEPLRLWRWLETLENRDHYQRKDSEEIANFLSSHSTVRQAIQRHVLFSTDIKPVNLFSHYGLRRFSSGLHLQPDDIVVHLEELAERNEMEERYREAWRTLVSASHTDNGIPDEIRIIAERISADDKELTAFLDPKPSPQAKKWLKQEKEWQAKHERRKLKEKGRRNTQRLEFAAHEKEMRVGDVGWVAAPAKAYFGRFSDVDTDKLPPDRIGEWLGIDLQEAALAGFEATLFRQDLPKPDQVANSYAESKFWHYIHPIMAGLAERWRRQLGFVDVSTEVILTGRIGIFGELIEESEGLKGFEDALDEFLRNDHQEFENFLRMWFEPQLSKGHAHITGLYKLARDANYRPFSTSLSQEWLDQFPELPIENEKELVYCLATSPVKTRAAAWGALKSLAERRQTAGYQTNEQQRLWQSVCFLVNFESSANWLSSTEVLNLDFLWAIRSIINVDRWDSTAALPISEKQLAWIIRSFRTLWPQSERPGGVSRGDTNDWNATEFLEWVILQLANETSHEAADLLTSLINSQEDDYTTQLRAARASQHRSRMEAAFQSARLDQISAALNDDPPTSAGELQAIVLNEISQLQKKIHGNATDTVDRFYDDKGKPRTENDCRDLLLDLLDPLPFGIQSSPEEAMPQKKRADVGFRLGTNRVPLEAKGQWHRDVWQAAASQLGQLYAKDYQSAGRGIYLVFWFGRDAPPGKRLKSPPGSLASPETPEQMQTMLNQEIPKGYRDSIAVFVLDLSKRASEE